MANHKRRRTMSLLKRVWLLCLLSGLMSEALAQLNPIPEEAGVSGFVNLGVGAVSGKSNLIAGTDLGDIGSDPIDSIFTKADSESSAIPLANFELAYTFGGKRTQVFAGNLLEDFVRFDFASQLGVRKQFRDTSILAVGYLFTSIPTEVWADPYVANVARNETDRTASGARITYGRIGGSGLELQYTDREVEVDDELSGLTQLGLPVAQAALLDREGDQRQFKATYFFKVSDKHRLGPALTFSDFDLDGEAMAHDRTGVEITHFYNGRRFLFITNVGLSSADYDAVNPIYLDKRDDDRIGVAFTLIDREAFGESKWWASAILAFFDEDSDIDFYDTEIALVGVSAFRRF